MGHLAHDQSAMVQILLVTVEAGGTFHMLTFCVLLATQSLVYSSKTFGSSAFYCEETSL